MFHYLILYTAIVPSHNSIITFANYNRLFLIQHVGEKIQTLRNHFNQHRSSVSLPLFLRGKLGTSKTGCGDKIQKKPCLFIFSSKKQAMIANGSALFCYAMIISVRKITQVIKSNTVGFLRIQRHNRKVLNRILKRPLKKTGIDQKRFADYCQ